MSISYGYSTILNDISFDEAIEKTTAALKAQGFGVITEIDVKETMRKKLDVDFRKYKILGACNPGFAHTALSHDLFIGLLLPCNVTVFEQNDGSINVSIVKPSEMFKVVNLPELESLASEVDASLQAVLAQINENSGATK